MRKIIKKRYVIIVLIFVITSGFTFYKSDYFEIAKQIEIFTTLYKNLNTSYVDELNHGKLMTTAINKMLDDIDPYTVFYNEQDIIAYRMRNRDEKSGIGADLLFKDKEVYIKSVQKNASADKAGIKSGDQLIAINNISIKDFGSNALNLLRNSSGTQIKIKYKRQLKLLETQLTIENEYKKSVPFVEMVNDKVGYMVLTEFSRTASKEVENALQRLKTDGAKSIILDLRGNPGGLLNEAINIVNLFVPKGKLIVSTKSKIKKYNTTYYTRKDAVDTEISIVALVDEHSASASEIVSGSLQDLDRGVVIGYRSFGKGLVQTPMDLVYGTQMKVTISRYYTPSGRCIQALDYSKRGKDGKAIRTSESNYNVFKTANGRPVYDGGGVMPDITLSDLKGDEYLDKLKYSHAIFDFANQYYYTHKAVDTSNFKLSSKDFEMFKNYLKTSENTPKTEVEDYLENQIKNQIKDSETVKSIQNVLKTIRNSHVENVEKHQEYVKTLLTNEILVRYIYKEGLYKYKLKNDIAIKKSIEILESPNRYKKILQL